MEMKAQPLAVLWLPSAQHANTQTHKDAQTIGSRARPPVSLDKQRVSAVICRGRDYTAVRLVMGAEGCFALCFEPDGRATLWWEMKGGNKYGGEANRDVWGSRRIRHRMDGCKLWVMAKSSSRMEWNACAKKKKENRCRKIDLLFTGTAKVKS